jgi:tRNA (guanosine-2'-O-)-methyltransferase
MRQKVVITERRLERIRHVLERRQKDLALILANIHDSHNVSAVFRSCDAFGIPAVHLYYTVSAFPILGTKTSASAGKWIERVRHTDAAAMVAGFRERGFQLISTGFTERARPLMEYDLTRPTAIIFGNEHRGVDAEIRALVPDEAYIPMQGMVQSLNVSVAAAVTLYEAWRQRQAKGMYDRPSYSDDELELLLDEWRRK